MHTDKFWTEVRTPSSSLRARDSFRLLLDQKGEKEALPESPQAFEVAAAPTSGLVNLVFSRQTGFSRASICSLINRWS